METSGAISFKVYLLQEKLEIETRRFAVSQTTACSYSQICEKLVEIFPKLNEKLFFIFWKDEDGDEVYVSSDEELIVALTSMKSEVKKFYIKIRDTLNCEDSKISKIVHPMVYCDECNKKIKGFRYKCIICKNYDLCSFCEQMSNHSEHPMLRIPTPDMIDSITTHKLRQILSSFFAAKSENLKNHTHHNKKHGEDNFHFNCHKRKRKYEKYESGHDLADCEEGCHRKHHHDKLKSMNHCIYGATLSEFWNLLNSFNFQSEKNENSDTAKQFHKADSEELPYAVHVKNIEKTISSFLNSLGINVDIEVQPSSSEVKEKIKSKNSDDSEKDQVFSDCNFSSKSESKEVTISEEASSQKENKKNNESPEKDDWVSFEDLKNEIEIMSSSNTEAIPKTVKPKSSVSFNIDEEKKTVLSSENNVRKKENQTLYPILNNADLPKGKDPKIKQALEKMLAMGFTNDGGWLTQLLEYKKGDINQVLEVLTPHNIR